jgi:glycosyltransferase involved in cell wall biosynthesis
MAASGPYSCFNSGRSDIASRDVVKILLVIPSLSHGGAERHVVRLASALRRRGVNPTVAVLNRDARPDLNPLMHMDGLRIEVPPHRSRDLRVVTWLARQLADVDVAHSFLWRGDVTLSAAARLAGFRRVICSERGDRLAPYYWSVGWWPRRLLDRVLTFRSARVLVANSRAGGDAAVRAGCPPDRVRVIHNGVDLREVDAAARNAQRLRAQHCWNNSPVVGFVGRLSVDKGPLDFVDIARDVAMHPAGKDVVFAMVGEGPLRPAVEQRIQSCGLTGRVTMIGAVDAPLSYMHAFDIGVICSPSESLPNALLEFMACGKPVVAREVGGLSEVIDRGRTGQLVDGPRGIAAGCAQLLGDPAERARVGEAARRAVEDRFQLPAVADQFLALYREVSRQP